MTRPAYLPALDRQVWSDLHRRPWAVSGRQYAVLVRLSTLSDWMRVTQRETARHLGYSLHGAHRALVSMRAGGLLAVRTRRGRNGGTWVRAARGLLAALSRNVPPVEGAQLAKVDRPVSTLGNISPDGPARLDGLELWRALGVSWGRTGGQTR